MNEEKIQNGAISKDEEEQPIESVPMYRRYKVIIPIMLLVVVLAAFLLKMYLGSRDFVTTDDAYVDGNRITVSAKILGRIVLLSADEGDSVKTGAVLVRLDDSDLKAQEIQAKAALNLAEENVKLAVINLAKAQDDFTRSQQQYKDRIIPKEQFDHAQNELEASGSRRSIAAAQVQSAKAQLGVIMTQLQNTVIYSPMDGIVSKRWALPGDVVQPAQPILSVYNLDSVWVAANLEETKISQLKLGDAVTISVDAYPGIEFTGKVSDLGANTASQFSLIPPNNAAGNFTKVTQRVPIKISFSPGMDGPGNTRLLPGMSVEVSVKVK